MSLKHLNDCSYVYNILFFPICQLFSNYFSLILQLFLLPAVYWLGEMKARAALLIFVMGAVFLTLGLSAGGLAATEEAIKRGILSALLLSAVLLAPSYLLSVSAMEKKEF